jgi:general stress protein 26
MTTAITSEKSKQPKCIEMPFSFICTHCKKETAKLTTKEELKEKLSEDKTRIIEYTEETEIFEGNWFEITDKNKNGLKIATCTCKDSNEGISIHDNQEIQYLFIDDEHPNGILLDAVVRINRKDIKKQQYLQSIRKIA